MTYERPPLQTKVQRQRPVVCVHLVPPYTGGKAVAAGSSILRLTVNREGGVKGAGCARAVWCECGVLPKTIVH